MKVNLVDPMPFHPLLCYPGTSQPLRAVAVRADGTAVWPLLGGDGDAEEAETGEEGDDSDSDTDEDAEDTDDDKGDDAAKNGKRKKSGPVSREEFERVKTHLSRSDQRRTEAEKERDTLKAEKEEQERKGKPELENVKRDLETATKERDSFRDRFTSLARTNAFLTASAQAGISWHDPEDAQAAGGKALRDLEIDEDGSVDGIKEFVKDLAKRKKYLVNAGKADESDDDQEDKSTRRRGASGSGVGSTRTSKGKGKPNGQLTDEELKKRFPALGRTR